MAAPPAAQAAYDRVDFSNTQIAFEARSSAELRKAYLLFQSFASPALIKAGARLLDVAFTMRLPVAPLVKVTVFDHFVGGVAIEECMPIMHSLARFNVRSILDYSVEGQGREQDFIAASAEFKRVIATARTEPAVAFSVFKVTALARFDLLAKVSAGEPLSPTEAAEWDTARARVLDLCRTAAAGGLRTLIDAEETWIQPAIDQLAWDAMLECNGGQALVFNTLQMYRHDRLAYLKQVYQASQAAGILPGFKLVRGAYMEKERARAANLGYPSPIQPTRAATDRDFDAALAFCVEHLGGLSLFAGSHNEQSNALLLQLMRDRGVLPNDPRITFSQLYGMSDHLTYNLAHAGFNAAKYLPYGPVRAVMPYLTRRAQENSSIKGQAGRELQLITKELARRRQSPAA